ncbi:MAG: Tyrosine-specific transport protein [Chlamydiia bacterium]|nr:Tyrosine-specific transport protein [Chlamydiia bacterium]
MRRRIQSILSKQFLGSLLIGGTAIGAAMLANPVATAGAGILPSYFVYLLCWLFSAATGMLFVELCSWLPKGANLLSMAETFLGAIGKWAVLLLYFFFFYLLLISYVSLGGKIVLEFICAHMPYMIGVLLFVAVFGGIVFWGTKAASRLNALLFVGLVMSFLIFIILAGEQAELKRADYWGWKYAFLGLPIIFTSFSYQGTVPTLYNYLDQDAKKTRSAILFGTLIPFMAYLIWDYLIKGIIPPTGAHGLEIAKAHGDSAIAPLVYYVNDMRIYTLARYFAFFALTTSFIGVTLAMVDFFADLFHVKAAKWNRLYLCLMIFVPVTIVVLINPNIFLVALSIAGGYGAVLLLGFMPIILVWMGRKQKPYNTKPRYLFGGSLILFVLLVALIAEVVVSTYVLR